MKAYLLNALQIDGKHFDASSENKPSIVDLDDAEFKRLADMLAVREPTDVEIKLFAALSGKEIEDAVVVEDKPAKGKAAKVEAPAETKSEEVI